MLWTQTNLFWEGNWMHPALCTLKRTNALISHLNEVISNYFEKNDKLNGGFPFWQLQISEACLRCGKTAMAKRVWTQSKCMTKYFQCVPVQRDLCFSKASSLISGSSKTVMRIPFCFIFVTLRKQKQSYLQCTSVTIWNISLVVQYEISLKMAAKVSKDLDRHLIYTPYKKLQIFP